MISFTINKVKIDNVHTYEDEISILNKYALKVSKSPDTKNLASLQTSPRFLRFMSREIEEFVDGGKYKLEDIRDKLKGMDIGEVADVENMTKMLIDYPFLTTADIGLLWLYTHDSVELDIGKFTEMYDEYKMRPHFLAINRQKFGTPVLIYRAAVSYISQIEDELKALKTQIFKEVKIYNDFNSVKKLPEITKFNLEETSEETFLRLPNKESLYDVFNAMDMSQNIPFAMLVDNVNKKTYYKVFGDISPPDEWINRYIIEDLSRCIYFYVLDSNIEVTSFSTPTSILKLYSEGLWKDGNSVELLFKLDSDESPVQLRDKITASLGGRIMYNVGETVQMSIKGTFSMPQTTLTASVFADLVFSNESISYYLFFNEQKKSVLNKKRFSFYYAHNQRQNHDNALTVTLTQSGTISSPVLDVRVSRASTKKQIDNFMAIFQRIYGVYTREYDTITKIYKSLYADANMKIITKKIGVEKENKKSRSRLIALQSQDKETQNPSAFKGSYVEKCQRKEQPYLVEPENLKNVKSMLKSTNFGKNGRLGKHGLLEWPLKSGNIYACVPRESDEQPNSYVWPGVVRTDPLDQDYDKYPYKPCCFAANQYTKNKGAYRDYISGNIVQSQIVTDRPLGENKMAPPDRTADLPYYIQLVSESAGYKKSQDKKGIPPIVRFGVPFGPDSFIHCLEYATNPAYSKKSGDQKNKIVKESLSKAATLDNYAIGRQELFNIETDEIRSHLSDEGSYIDPDLYIRIFEKIYNCNIIVFKVDKDNLNGELSFPRYVNVYLDKALNINRETVIIVKYGISTDWPYQCELIAKYNKKETLEYIFKSTDPLIELVSTIRHAVNTVYMTSPSGTYKKYIPISV